MAPRGGGGGGGGKGRGAGLVVAIVSFFSAMIKCATFSSLLSTR